MKASPGEATASAIRAAPMATAQIRRGCGASPRIIESARGDAPCGHRLEDAVGCLAADLGLRPEDEAVPKRRREESLDVVRGNELRAIERGQRSRGQHEEDLGPGARAERDLWGCASRRRQLEDVAADLLVDDDLGNLRAAGFDVLAAEDRLDACLRRVAQLDSGFPAP